MICHTHTPEETEAAGEALARDLLSRGKRRVFIAMFGEMGVGKTAFARGVGRGLGIRDVKSPTYTVVSEHRGDPVPLFHFDLYRIEGADDLFTVGFDDYLARDGFLLSEWSERIPEEIPEDAVRVTIERGETENERIITTGGIL